VLSVEPETNSAVQELQRLAKAGFEVRDFFGCHESDKKRRPARARILLERVTRNSNTQSSKL
jgi:hypothetical protein